VCGFVEQFSLVETQKIQELNLKSIINFLKLMGKVGCRHGYRHDRQIRLTTWPLLHIYADLAKNIGDK